MSLSIHLHGLHLDAQYGHTRHLSTTLRSGERTGRRLLWSTTLLLLTLLMNEYYYSVMESKKLQERLTTEKK